MEQFLLNIVSTINSYLSNYILIILLVGVGLFYTIRTKFVQIRCFGAGMKQVFGNFSLKGGKQKSGLSSFQALATAIAAQVGTGNIVGACGAILIGGPGAIFWMWIIAFFGMATIYAEAIAAQKTRVVDEDGTVHGGPVYYITSVFKGKGGKFLAGFFAVAAMLALGFMGSMVQSNSIGESMHNAFNIPTWVVGLVVTVIAGFILGPISALAITLVTATLELITISQTGFIGFVMNIISTSFFVVPATLIYQKKRTLFGAIVGLAVGVLSMCVAMMLWNYLITPLYMAGTTREMVAKMLPTVFLPFNLIKGTANASLAMLSYKPLVNALRKTNMLESIDTQGKGSERKILLIIVSACIFAVCVLGFLIMGGVI